MPELAQGKATTGFADSEEQAVGLIEVVPLLVERILREIGGYYSKAPGWQPRVDVDGLLVTGQYPASSEPAAKALLAQLDQQAAPQAWMTSETPA